MKMAEIIKFQGVCSDATENDEIKNILRGEMVIVECENSTIVDTGKIRIKLPQYKIKEISNKEIILKSKTGGEINIAAM